VYALFRRGSWLFGLVLCVFVFSCFGALSSFGGRLVLNRYLVGSDFFFIAGFKVVFDSGVCYD
jgi:nitrogen fixation protein FixH